MILEWLLDILNYQLPRFSMFMEPSSSTLVTIEIDEEDDDYNRCEVRDQNLIIFEYNKWNLKLCKGDFLKSKKNFVNITSKASKKLVK